MKISSRDSNGTFLVGHLTKQARQSLILLIAELVLGFSGKINKEK
jgi:hypothetical protein